MLLAFNQSSSYCHPLGVLGASPSIAGTINFCNICLQMVINSDGTAGTPELPFVSLKCKVFSIIHTTTLSLFNTLSSWFLTIEGCFGFGPANRREIGRLWALIFRVNSV